MKKYSIKNIEALLKGSFLIKGSPEGKFFTNVRPAEEADENTIIWIHPGNPKRNELIQQTPAQLIVCDHSLNIPVEVENHKCFIVVENPKNTYTNIVKSFFLPELTYEIHSSAIIDPEAVIHKEVFIGPNTRIGKATIGKQSAIYENCSIGDNVIIGSNVKIYPNAVIGQQGFGYSLNEEGHYEHFPHVGKVIIEDHVEIGSLSSVVRGTLGNTHIKRGTKIDCFVQVGHNVVVGENCLIHAQSVIGGSTVIGNNTSIYLGVTIINKLTIGNNVSIGPGSVIISDVKDNVKMAARPAMQLPQ